MQDEQKDPPEKGRSENQYLKLIDNIPQEMRKLKRWVLTELRSDSDLDKPGKYKKIPINAKTLWDGKSTNPADWNTFEEALLALQKNPERYACLGFILTKEDRITCVDLDKCIDESSNLSDRAREIIMRFSMTYIERSLSGKGLHIFCKGTKPGLKCRKGNIEIYDQKRLIAITGDVYHVQ